MWFFHSSIGVKTGVRWILPNIRPIQFRHFNSFASTIYALSTNVKPSGSAIAVVRVAGPETIRVLDLITKGRAEYYRKYAPRKAILQNLYDFQISSCGEPNYDGTLIDKAMLLWFPAPNSYTGEDMCEFHIHGSQAVINKLLSVLSQIDRCRPAQEGEFTKRALVNGKLGLIEAEAIRDLVSAQTDAQRRRALTGLSNSLSTKFHHWRKEMIRCLAHLEAFIDFSEDELIDQQVMRQLEIDLRQLNTSIDHFVRTSKQRSDFIKDGFSIAIVGEPNVGKSSLINQLCQKDLSIISPMSGTTRDVVEGWINFAGYVVRLADTAGIKDLHQLSDNGTVDEVEREGIKRAIARVQECHLAILVLDARTCLEQVINDQNCLPIPEYLEKVISDRKVGDNLLIVINKIDLLNTKQQTTLTQHFQSKQLNYLSCLVGSGFEHFITTLQNYIELRCGSEQDQTSHSLVNVFSNDRHVAHLEKTVLELNAALDHLNQDLAIAALHLQQALYQLACLTGQITTDDVLDVIFKDFCIGK